MSNFNDDLDDFVKEVSIPNKCPVSRLLNHIDTDHGKDVSIKFNQIINDPVYSAPRISTLLRNHGYKLGRDSIYKHRRKGQSDGCICQ